MGDLLTFRPAWARGTRRGTIRGSRATDWYERGCALERSDPAGAMAAYRRAIAGRPDLADAHNNLGRLHHDRGELTAAEGCYRVACCIAPAVALYWFNLGVAIEDRGGLGEAVASYERAIDAATRGGDAICADAHWNLARLLELDARRAGDAHLYRRAVGHLARYRSLMRAAGRGR